MVKLSKPLTDADFEKKDGKYFNEGVYEVYLTSAVKDKSPGTGSEFIEFEVLGSEDQTGKTRLYLTEKTVDRSIAILGAICVHNQSTEENKQKVRDAFKAIDDSDKIDDKFLAKLVDKQAWILVEEDKSAPKPNGGFYLRYNLYSYEPQPRKTTAEDLMSASKPLTAEEQAEIPFE